LRFAHFAPSPYCAFARIALFVAYLLFQRQSTL